LVKEVLLLFEEQEQEQEQEQEWEQLLTLLLSCVPLQQAQLKFFF